MIFRHAHLVRVGAGGAAGDIGHDQAGQLDDLIGQLVVDVVRKASPPTAMACRRWRSTS